MRMATCHQDRKHYCRGLCHACYNTLNKQRHKINVVMATCHPERRNVGRGMCYGCYAAFRASPDYLRVRTKGRARCVNHPDKPADARKLCKACYTAWRRAQDPQRNAFERRKDRAAVYGITLAEYDRLKSTEHCQLCAKYLPTGPDRHIDHCHETGRVRGVLCFTCNKALGMLGDNEHSIRRVLAYVRAEHGIVLELPGERAA